VIRVWFKSHRNATREYYIETPDNGAAHFVRAALEANHWLVVRVERPPGCQPSDCCGDPSAHVPSDA
jgi:hypothetical protein